MGREAVAVCRWKGEVAEVKLHLDSKAFSLRGDIRLDLPRDAIRTVNLIAEGLQLVTDGPDMVIELAEGDALRWQKALLKTPPTLAVKLGVSPATPAFVLGAYDDVPLAQALQHATVPTAEDAAILLAVLSAESDLHGASDLAMQHPDKHIWMIHKKGKAAAVGDTMIRMHMRGLGFIDSKTSAVSDILTTTRYRLRQSS